MILLDSSAWLEILAEGGNQAFVRAYRRAREILVPSVCLYEITKRLLQVFPVDAVAERIGAISARGTIAPLDADVAARAAHVAVGTGLGMADAIIYTTARSHDATLWTQDVHFQHLDGVRYVPRIAE